VSALVGVYEAVRAVDEAELAVLQAVRVSRGEGASWAAIGAVLGVSAQAAHARFRARL